jgi:hypothetical protein
MSVEEQAEVMRTGLAASFVQNASDLPAAVRVPEPRQVVEREEA